jgi:hypothetical protein
MQKKCPHLRALFSVFWKFPLTGLRDDQRFSLPKPLVPFGAQSVATKAPDELLSFYC